jgi:hypothetical protein
MFPHGIDVFALVLTVFWVWMLIDAFTNTRLRGNAKFGWVIFIFLTHVLGAAIYFFTARSRSSQRSTQYQNTQQYMQQRPVPPPVNAVPYYQPSRPSTEAAPGSEVNGDYREGYQGATPGPIGIQTLSQQPMEVEPRADWQGDEHPTAAYPVLPPQPTPPQPMPPPGQ